METQNRRSPRHLIEEIQREPSRYRFFQTVRMLSLLQKPRSEKRNLPANLRFRTPASLAFPASEQSALRDRAAAVEGDATLQELEVNFMGLNGPSGMLPNHYTEQIIDRRTHYRDTGMHEFFDIFNHRSLSLFYSAWRKYRFWISYEAGERDGFSRNLLDMAGVGLNKLGNQIAVTPGAVPDRFFMQYAGLLAQKPLSAMNLATIIQSFFEVTAELEQFVGQWINLPDEEQICLGQQGSTLGVDAVAGERVWERQNKLRLTLGPLDKAQFSAFLPDAPAAKALAMLMQFAFGHSLACDITLILRRDAIPDMKMAAGAGLMLGFNTWAASMPATEDSADVHYALLQ